MSIHVNLDVRTLTGRPRGGLQNRSSRMTGPESVKLRRLVVSYLHVRVLVRCTRFHGAQ